MNLSALSLRVRSRLLSSRSGSLWPEPGFLKLPVSPLPQVDFPTINVQATLPGANPIRSPPPSQARLSATSANRRRHRMTSKSSLGATAITLQFNINRDIDGAARDVQAAINAAHADLPTSLRTNPPTTRSIPPTLRSSSSP